MYQLQVVKMNFTDLPSEILLIIFEWLPDNTIRSIKLTNKYLNYVCDTNWFWYKRIDKRIDTKVSYNTEANYQIIYKVIKQYYNHDNKKLKHMCQYGEIDGVNILIEKL